MIFRRENRGESFQRQISNLRQKQQDDTPAEEEEQQYNYENHEEYDPDDPGDTGQFSTEQGTPGEGISFPSSRPEQSERVPDEPSIASPPPPPPAPAQPTYQETRQWQAPAASAPPTADASTSTISRHAYWNGTLKSEGSLHVHGKADGELHSETDLYVAEGAEVDASLHADSVVVAGLVRGKIEARSRLEVLPQGEVTGDVRSPKLVVHEGATISGQLKMEEVGSSTNQGGTPVSGGN
ncbi:MAG: polymer-forming cytoskeletal protein [Thermomicrobiaceae bacterium]